MGLSSSLNAGVMGLAVNAVKLGTISDNIANSKTYGYKRSDAEFQDMVLSQSAGAYSPGGVSATAYRDVGAQGALTTTSNSMDIAISGQGMLPVTNASGITSAPSDRDLLLTSTGSFSTDDEGYLRTLGGNFLMGWPTDSTGAVTSSQVRDSVVGLEPVLINLNQFSSSPTTNVNLGVNLPATETEFGAAGTAIDLPIEYFDTLGRSETLTLTFTPTIPAAAGSSNQWTVTVFDSASATPATAIATYTTTFDDTGSNAGFINTVTAGAGATYDAAANTITVTTATGTVALGLSGMTQLASSYAPLNVTKDGSTIGNLASLEIDDDGFIQAVYDTGLRETIYQIPVANVPNFRGLDSAGNGTFQVSQDSGSFYLWDAGDGPVGTTSGFSLAESTSDIAQELTDLIETQRAYSSNAKIIQTVDEMLQETTDIVR